MVDSYVPGVETILRPNEHWILAPESELLSTVERTIELNDDQLRKIGMDGAKHVFNHHTQAHRVATLMENVRRLRIIRDNGTEQLPYLPFFLPEIDSSVEQHFAALNWPELS